MQLLSFEVPGGGEQVSRAARIAFTARADALDREDSSGGKKAMGRFEKRRHSFLSHADALGGLAATDGCVVLGET